ncbi:MAG: diaminopimelate decarboxylase [Acidobacteriota bacterium]|nr:diaminopimelate decarboxylase [Acidobacteriota bacterium]
MRAPFEYVGDHLQCDQVRLADVAQQAGTPCYVYSASAILDRFRAYDQAFADHPHRVCYAVKANSSLAILKLLGDAGAGFDIVSAGELYRVLKAGGTAGKVVFSGVGKTADEVDYALSERIHSFNCESEAELSLIDDLAGRRGVKASVALRVNPDVDATTHPYISTGLREHKFGVDIGEAEGIYSRVKSLTHLIADGVSCHIGSQITDTRPLMEVVDKMLALVERLRSNGCAIRTLDLGGGLGVAYHAGQAAPSIPEFVQAVCAKAQNRSLEIMIEPGRSIVAEAGVLLTRVLYRKHNGTKEFVIVDAGMNDLIRPALYQSHHDIVPLVKDGAATIKADIVGPVCETGDFLARDRDVRDVQPGAYMAICAAGAYGFVASSNYNSRPKPPEILVEGQRWRIIRERETFDDLVRGES